MIEHILKDVSVLTSSSVTHPENELTCGLTWFGLAWPGLASETAH